MLFGSRCHCKVFSDSLLVRTAARNFINEFPRHSTVAAHDSRLEIGPSLDDRVDRGRGFHRYNMRDKKAPVPVRLFSVGYLLREPTGVAWIAVETLGPAKVVRVSEDRKFISLSSDGVRTASGVNVFQCKLQVCGPIEVAAYGDGEDEMYLEYSVDGTVQWESEE